MKTYVKFGILMSLIVGSLVWLAVGGVSDTKTYYKTIPELQQMGNSARSHRLRVAGDVQPGSIVKSGSEVSFVLHQEARTLKVVYTGMDPLPDTFRDNAQALADGHLGTDGVFQAQQDSGEVRFEVRSQADTEEYFPPGGRGKDHQPAATHPSGRGKDHQPAATIQ